MPKASVNAEATFSTETLISKTLQFDFVMGTIACVKKADLPAGAVCPGNFKLNCEDDDVGSDFNGEEDCEVNNLSPQIRMLWVSTWQINQIFSQAVVPKWRADHVK